MTAWTREPVYGDALFAFRQIVETANERHLPILLAGDCMDGKSYGSSLVAQVRDILSRLEQPLYYVLGDHDDADLGLFAAFDLPNIICLDRSLGDIGKIYLPGSDIRLGGFSYRSAANAKEALQQLPEDVTHVLLHQTQTEFTDNRFPGEISAEDYPDHIRYAYVGDIHKPFHNLTVQRASGVDLTLVSPGSLVPQAIDEIRERRILFLDAAGNVFQDNHRLLARHVMKALILTDDDLDDLVEKKLSGWVRTAWEIAHEENLPPLVRQPMVVLRYSPGMRHAEERVRSINARLPDPAIILSAVHNVDAEARETKSDKTALKEAETVLADGLAAVIPVVLAQEPEVAELLLGALRSQRLAKYLQTEAGVVCNTE